ncbi:MAG: hypothetical protein KF789_06580 [Bdellovibrionaceae bacterium]|nr:hypothetical protein [Pseudobdellovibrionaceae bacterium]
MKRILFLLTLLSAAFAQAESYQGLNPTTGNSCAVQIQRDEQNQILRAEIKQQDARDSISFSVAEKTTKVSRNILRRAVSYERVIYQESICEWSCETQTLHSTLFFDRNNQLTTISAGIWKRVKSVLIVNGTREWAKQSVCESLKIQE